MHTPRFLQSALNVMLRRSVMAVQTTTNVATTATAPVARVAARAVKPALAAASVHIAQFFVDGAFAFRPVFKYNNISVRNLLNRRAVLMAIKVATKDEFMAIPFPQRRAIFAFLKQETKRYYGDALRQTTTEYGVAGTPLPRLVFPTRQDAAAYRQLLQDAERTIREHIVHTPVPAASEPAMVAQA